MQRGRLDLVCNIMLVQKRSLHKDTHFIHRHTSTETLSCRAGNKGAGGGTMEVTGFCHVKSRDDWLLKKVQLHLYVNGGRERSRVFLKPEAIKLA